MKILIIEEIDHFWNNYQSTLPDYDTMLCHTLDEALHIVSEHGIDLLIVNFSNKDIHLKSIKEIKERAGRHVFVIAIVEHTMSNIGRLIEAGVDDIVRQPFTANYLNLRVAIAQTYLYQHHEVTFHMASDVIDTNAQHVIDSLAACSALIDTNKNIVYRDSYCLNIMNACSNNNIGRNILDVLEIDAKGLKELSNAIDDNVETRRVVTISDSKPVKKLKVEVIKDGFDFFNKQNENKLILLKFHNCHTKDSQESLDASSTNFCGMVGKDIKMLLVQDKIRLYAKTNVNVLIEGETGTGKDLVAKALHTMGRNADKPYISINCTGLTESLLASQLFGHKKGSFTGAVTDQKGFFEAAEGGTIFLDEIGDASLSVQSFILRAIENKEIIPIGETKPKKVNVRVIAATNKNLLKEAKQGNFREDLYYRLKSAKLTMPPLRERKGDIRILVEYFLQTIPAEGNAYTISPETVDTFMKYNWPGNVRELRNVIEIGIIHAHKNVVSLSNLSAELLDDDKISSLTAERLESLIQNALKFSGNNKSKAAELLGISRTTLYRLLNSNKKTDS